MTLKFDGWPRKTIMNLFLAPRSYVCHFIVIWFELKLPTRHAQIGTKSLVFQPMWPWNLTDDLENNRALLCYFKLLCIILLPSVNSNWSYSPETANSGQNWQFFCPLWPWNLTHDLEKVIGHLLFYPTSSIVHYFVAIGEFKLELQSGNAQFGSKLTI